MKGKVRAGGKQPSGFTWAGGLDSRTEVARATRGRERPRDLILNRESVCQLENRGTF